MLPEDILPELTALLPIFPLTIWPDVNDAAKETPEAKCTGPIVPEAIVPLTTAESPIIPDSIAPEAISP